jgi:hypothetical protein
MTTAVAHSHLRRGLPPQLRWITVLLVGSALYGAVLAALLGTQDILYVPSLLVIGAAVAPATFTTFIGGLLGRGRLSVVQIAIAAALGGVIGTVVAGTLEYETIRTLGSLPTLAIGFIEESAKLAVPAVILGWRRPLPTDGCCSESPSRAASRRWRRWDTPSPRCCTAADASSLSPSCSRSAPWPSPVVTRRGPAWPAPPSSPFAAPAAAGSAGSGSAWSSRVQWSCTPCGTAAPPTWATSPWVGAASRCSWPRPGCSTATRRRRRSG